MSTRHEDVTDDAVDAVDQDTTDNSGVAGTPAIAEGRAPALAVPAGQLRAAIEAILMIVDEPVGQVVLAQVLATPVPEVVEILCSLQTEYDEAGRGFELREVAGGWRLYTRAELASYVERFVLEGQQARLTQAPVANWLCNRRGSAVPAFV